METIITRSKFTAVVLALTSIKIPGLGYLFAGKPKVALLLAAFGLLLDAIVVGTPAIESLYFMVLAAVILVVFILFIVIDCYRVNTNPVVLGRFNQWPYYLLFTFFILSCQFATIFYLSHYESLRIVNTSNEPLFKSGDRVLIKTQTLNESMQQKPMHFHNGQMVAFFDPKSTEQRILLRRIVAQSGDRLAIKKGVVFVNSKPLNEYYVLTSNKLSSSKDEVTEFKIPLGYVFLLGDNRDNSVDSRAFGPLPQSSIKGPALYVFWSPQYIKSEFASILLRVS